MRKIFICLSWLIPLLAQASIYDGNRLSAWADADDRVSNSTASEKDAYVAFQLIGYVAGVHDSKSGLNLYCAPSNVTVGQMVAIVKKSIRSNPENWGMAADYLVARALRQAFPCTK